MPVAYLNGIGREQLSECVNRSSSSLGCRPGEVLNTTYVFGSLANRGLQQPTLARFSYASTAISGKTPSSLLISGVFSRLHFSSVQVLNLAGDLHEFVTEIRADT